MAEQGYGNGGGAERVVIWVLLLIAATLVGGFAVMYLGAIASMS